MYYVYELIDPRNNKPFYIGKGTGLRMYFHAKNVKRGKIPHGNKKLFNKIKKIMNGNMKIKYKKIFITENENDAYEKEIKRINEIGIDSLCNLTYGGEGLRATNEVVGKIVNTRRKNGNYKMSDYTKDLISKSISKVMKERWKNKEFRKKMSEKLSGENSPVKRPEVREKISNSLKGKVFSQERRRKISEIRKGKTWEEIYSKSGLEKMRSINFFGENNQFYGKTHTEENKKLFAQYAKELHTGRKRSEETKQRIKTGIKNSKHSEIMKSSEMSEKISRATKEAMKDPEIRKKCAYWKGKHQSEEHKRKISEKLSLSLKGKPKSEEHKSALRRAWELRKKKYI